jgi:hypothetical protein
VDEDEDTMEAKLTLLGLAVYDYATSGLHEFQKWAVIEADVKPPNARFAFLVCYEGAQDFFPSKRKALEVGLKLALSGAQRVEDA